MGTGGRIWQCRMPAATTLVFCWAMATERSQQHPRLQLEGPIKARWQWGILTGTGDRTWRSLVFMAILSAFCWATGMGRSPRRLLREPAAIRNLWLWGISTGTEGRTWPWQT